MEWVRTPLSSLSLVVRVEVGVTLCWRGRKGSLLSAFLPRIPHLLRSHHRQTVDMAANKTCASLFLRTIKTRYTNLVIQYRRAL